MGKSFRELLVQAIRNTNEMYSEEGTYFVITLVSGIDSNVTISFINMIDETKINAYVVDLNELEGPYIRKYEDDGGDEEYGDVCMWIVDEEVIAQFGQRLNVVC